MRGLIFFQKPCYGEDFLYSLCNFSLQSANSLINGDFDYPTGIMLETINNNEIMEWKSKASEVRSSLLTKLKEALVGQNYPSAIATAESFEVRAFNEANTLNDYQFKLAQWLATIYEGHRGHGGHGGHGDHGGHIGK